MSQGIEDGYLAACEILRRDIFLIENCHVSKKRGVSALIWRTRLWGMQSPVRSAAPLRRAKAMAPRVLRIGYSCSSASRSHDIATEVDEHMVIPNPFHGIIVIAYRCAPTTSHAMVQDDDDQRIHAWRQATRLATVFRKIVAGLLCRKPPLPGLYSKLGGDLQ